MALITGQPEDLESTNELDKLDRPIQGSLIEAAWVKFSGSSHIALEDPPELDESRTYIVKATCKGVNHALRKDNEERVTVVLEIDSCYERGKVPIVDENQGSLFDHGDDEDQDGDGE